MELSPPQRTEWITQPLKEQNGSLTPSANTLDLSPPQRTEWITHPLKEQNGSLTLLSQHTRSLTPSKNRMDHSPPSANTMDYSSPKNNKWITHHPSHQNGSLILSLTLSATRMDHSPFQPTEWTTLPLKQRMAHSHSPAIEQITNTLKKEQKNILFPSASRMNN